MDGFLRAYQSSKAVGPPLAEAHTSTLEVSVTNIVFNHAAGSLTGDAIELRKDFATALPRPEYTRAGESFAAYVGGTTPVTVQVRFEVVSPDPVSTLTLRGISTDSAGGGTLSDTDEKVVTVTNGVSHEGTDDPATPWDDSEYVTFTTEGAVPSQVNQSDEYWAWQITASAPTPLEHPIAADTSGPHHTYVLYAAPEIPWTQTVDEPHNPWVSLLTLACDWAENTPNPATVDPSDKEREIVATLIPGIFNGMRDLGKVYLPLPTHCNTAVDCDLTAILSEAEPSTDCFDLSGLLVLASHALGVGADASLRYQVLGDFQTRPVLPFHNGEGFPCPEYPGCWHAYTWARHSFGWFEGKVYDGTLMLNFAEPRHPIGEERDTTYKDDLYLTGLWTPVVAGTVSSFH
jgi:hypothetical protein